jgi:2-polyprenyl-6-methoxyphenol hydroxylase-like FAD-dependent oxidoreductase
VPCHDAIFCGTTQFDEPFLIARRTATFSHSLDKVGQNGPVEAGSSTWAAAGTADVTVGYDMLVGADGSSSAVRAAMLGAVPGMHMEVPYRGASTYK